MDTIIEYDTNCSIILRFLLMVVNSVRHLVPEFLLLCLF